MIFKSTKKEKMLIVVLISITLLLTSFTNQISAIQYRDIVTIQIAFQHGFKYAIRLDEKTYSLIKKNPELLRDKAIECSQEYLKIVTSINP